METKDSYQISGEGEAAKKWAKTSFIVSSEKAGWSGFHWKLYMYINVIENTLKDNFYLFPKYISKENSMSL